MREGGREGGRAGWREGWRKEGRDGGRVVRRKRGREGGRERDRGGGIREGQVEIHTPVYILELHDSLLSSIHVHTLLSVDGDWPNPGDVNP